MIYAIIGAVVAAFALGSTIGYCVGRADGEDEVAWHYEDERRKWATNEKGGAE